MDRRGIVIGVLACLAAAAVVVTRQERPLSASAATPSGGVRPGPAVLYAPPPSAPQLENRSEWFRAPPLLVSGAEATAAASTATRTTSYDDYGADTGVDDPVGGASAGDLSYPTERSRYGENAADLVEFRVSVRRDAVAYRVTLNTLLAADSTIVAVAFDTDRQAASGVARLPRDPGAPFPGTDEAITLWGTGAEHTRFAPGARGVPGSRMPITTPLRLPSARHVPFLNVVAAEDQLVPLAGTRAQSLGAPELGVAGFEQLGYRYRFVVYNPAVHSTLAAYGYDIPMAGEFLGAARVTHDPAHVTFVYAPAADDPALGLIHDHAYWVSALAVAPGATRGTIDVRSHATGRGDPEGHATHGAGHGPLPFLEWSRSWGDTPEMAADNRLTINVSGLSAAGLDVARAGIDPEAPLVVELTADAPGVLHLAGLGDAGRDLTYGPGTQRFTLAPGA
jgi:hypothetical protein